MESVHKITANLHNKIIPIGNKTCLYDSLDKPKRILIKRTIANNVTNIYPSLQTKFNYSFKDGIEILEGVPLRHDFKSCPGGDQNISEGESSQRLCICIIIKKGDQFLATQRSLNISFPGAWVFPGGGIEQGQTIFQAAQREVKQQIGLDVQIDLISSKPILWQSFYVVNNKVKRSNLVLFFESSRIPEGQIKLQQSQVMDVKWRSLLKPQQDQIAYDNKTKTGFAQGHLCYLKYLRSKLKQTTDGK